MIRLKCSREDEGVFTTVSDERKRGVLIKKEHQQAFEAIKEYLSRPPVLMKDKPFKLYISANEESIASLLA